MLVSRDKANFVSQEAYERARASSTRDQSLALNLAVRDGTRALFAKATVLCVRAFYR